MPVSFFIDPQLVNDKDAHSVTHVTLSYTFYPVAPAKPGVAGPPVDGGPATPATVQRSGQAG
jgi:cytochrome c oxidase assembly protein subunit 11